MAEAEGIPPTASVASVGPGINYIKNWVYAYSGKVENAAGGSGSQSVLLEFISGDGFIVSNFTWGISFAGSNDSYTTIKFNDLEVFTATIIESGGAVPFSPLILVIPPFTKVTMLWGIDGATKSATGVFTGRVYDV